MYFSNLSLQYSIFKNYQVPQIPTVNLNFLQERQSIILEENNVNIKKSKNVFKNLGNGFKKFILNDFIMHLSNNMKEDFTKYIQKRSIDTKKKFLNILKFKTTLREYFLMNYADIYINNSQIQEEQKHIHKQQIIYFKNILNQMEIQNYDQF